MKYISQTLNVVAERLDLDPLIFDSRFQPDHQPASCDLRQTAQCLDIRRTQALFQPCNHRLRGVHTQRQLPL